MSVKYGIEESKVIFNQQRTATTNDPAINESSKQVTGTDIGFKRALDVSVSTGLLSNIAFDYVQRTLNVAGDEETWTYKVGGSGGDQVAQVIVTYTDATRSDISSVSRTTP